MYLCMYICGYEAQQYVVHTFLGTVSQKPDDLRHTSYMENLTYFGN